MYYTQKYVLPCLLYLLHVGVLETQQYHLGPGAFNDFSKINSTLLTESLQTSKRNMDPSFTTVNLIKQAGFVAETHEVTTEDRYILTLHRITKSESESETGSEKKPVVILQHGLFCSSAVWVLNGAENSLGFILSDQGYDVWLPNIRGNTYSRRHEFLDPDKDAERFFDFSFHEMAIYDTPAIIDYILKTTGQSDVYYVGHSMGTTISYILSSVKPEYNDKIKAIFSFAPIAYVDNVNFSMKTFVEFVENVLSLLKVYEVMPQSQLTLWADNHVCNDNMMTNMFCQTFVEMLVGFDYKQIDKEIMHRIVAISPSGSSLKAVQHYVQFLRSSRFRMFDYGKIVNMLKYNNPSPPEYPIQTIKPPVLLFHGTLDILSVEKDVQRLYKELPPSSKNKMIEIKFNHLDFLYAKDVRKLLYDQVVTAMQDFQQEQKGV